MLWVPISGFGNVVKTWKTTKKRIHNPFERVCTEKAAPKLRTSATPHKSFALGFCLDPAKDSAAPRRILPRAILGYNLGKTILKVHHWTFLGHFNLGGTISR